jgi:hypothetical protein
VLHYILGDLSQTPLVALRLHNWAVFQYRSSPNFEATYVIFPQYVLTLTKKLLDYVLGDFSQTPLVALRLLNWAVFHYRSSPNFEATYVIFPQYIIAMY